MFGPNGFYQYHHPQSHHDQQMYPGSMPMTCAPESYPQFEQHEWQQSYSQCWSSSLNVKHEPNNSSHAGSSSSSSGALSDASSIQDSDASRLTSSSLPGVEFDPSTRRFSVDELRPLPIMRKRRKVSTMKDKIFVHFLRQPYIT